ncbi:MAG: ABC transporter ATP-binding protein [Actinobacteria bacterium]|nr:ABC transporter ATP-binding protein [Actinomycetota bacterium]
MTDVLEFDSVSAGYGPFKALFDVSFTVGAGAAVALVGPNGSGKTTVARVASGLVRASSGAVRVGGEDFTGRRAFEFARAGVAHAVEGRSVFATLSVADNLSLSFGRSRGRRGVGAALDEAYELFPILAERRGQLAGTLSGGQQRMLSMARVLVEAPALLIADELSLGLAPIIIDQIYEKLALLRSRGTALLIVEQHVSRALELCDTAVLLRRGSVSWRGPADDALAMVMEQGVAGRAVSAGDRSSP